MLIWLFVFLVCIVILLLTTNFTNQINNTKFSTRSQKKSLSCPPSKVFLVIDDGAQTKPVAIERFESNADDSNQVNIDLEAMMMATVGKGKGRQESFNNINVVPTPATVSTSVSKLSPINPDVDTDINLKWDEISGESVLVQMICHSAIMEREMSGQGMEEFLNNHRLLFSDFAALFILFAELFVSANELLDPRTCRSYIASIRVNLQQTGRWNVNEKKSAMKIIAEELHASAVKSFYFRLKCRLQSLNDNWRDLINEYNSYMLLREMLYMEQNNIVHFLIYVFHERREEMKSYFTKSAMTHVQGIFDKFHQAIPKTITYQLDDKKLRDTIRLRRILGDRMAQLNSSAEGNGKISLNNISTKNNHEAVSNRCIFFKDSNYQQRCQTEENERLIKQNFNDVSTEKLYDSNEKPFVDILNAGLESKNNDQSKYFTASGRYHSMKTMDRANIMFNDIIGDRKSVTISTKKLEASSSNPFDRISSAIFELQPMVVIPKGISMLRNNRSSMQDSRSNENCISSLSSFSSMDDIKSQRCQQIIPDVENPYVSSSMSAVNKNEFFFLPQDR